MLLATDKHYWFPIDSVLGYLKGKFCGKTVLDVGPGSAPLPWSTTAVDFVDTPGVVVNNMVKCDFAEQPLPFEDKSFDFIYCRHALEDMYNPFHLLKEMERVGKAGYIESPSPIAELTRNVDGTSHGVCKWRGYHHHRFIIWVYNKELRFVSKYPLVEYIGFAEEPLEALLKKGAKYWNTYYLWEGQIQWKHKQNPLDFDMIRSYGPVLSEACSQSKDAADKFWSDCGISEESQKIVGLKKVFA